MKRWFSLSPETRKYLYRAASIILAIGLLYLALRGIDLTEVWNALKKADYRWLLPLAVVVLASHLIRAWRWIMLLNTVPNDDPSPTQDTSIGLGHAFSSLMIGYMVNYAAPRLGEVARSANLSRRTSISFSSVFGTVAVERALDVTVLAIALLSVGLLELNHLILAKELFVEPIINYSARLPFAWIAAGIGVLLLLGTATYLLWQRTSDGKQQLPGWWSRHVKPVLSAFRTGWMTLFRSERPTGLVVSTVLMWVTYLFMAYIPLVMLGIADPYSLSLLDGWVIMVLGTLGILVPVPGGTGSYHYVTIQTLVYLFSVDAAPAASYAVLTHAAQLVLYAVVGSICLALQGNTIDVGASDTIEHDAKRAEEYST